MQDKSRDPITRDWHARAAKPLLIMQLQTLGIISSAAPWKTSLKAKGDNRRASQELRIWILHQTHSGAGKLKGSTEGINLMKPL